MATRIEERVLSGLDRRIVPTILLIGLAVVVTISAILLLASNNGSGVAETGSVDVTIDADTFRWTAVGDFYSAQAQVRQVHSDAVEARWDAIGTFYSAQTDAKKLVLDPDVFRWTAIGDFYTAKEVSMDKARQEAEAARWNAMGKVYIGQFQPQLLTNAAEAARWNAVGEFYAAQAEAQAKLRQDAEVARWIAMGEFYAAQAELR